MYGFQGLPVVQANGTYPRMRWAGKQWENNPPKTNLANTGPLVSLALSPLPFFILSDPITIMKSNYCVI